MNSKTETPQPGEWGWTYGVIHFHGNPKLRERFYAVTKDLHASASIVDIWLNDIGKVLEEHGYKMTITRPRQHAPAQP